MYNLKYGRGANCERSHYMKTAGRKCFATAENLQVQSDHHTVTLHLAWRLRSVDGYLPYRKGWIRCHRLHVSIAPSFHFSSSDKVNTLKILIFLPPFPRNFLCFSRFISCPSFLSFQPTLPHRVSVSFSPPLFYLPLQTFLFLPLSPSFSLCLWSVTLNLAPSICFSSFV